MTGDEFEEIQNNEKTDNINDKIDSTLLLNLTENYLDQVENIPCPEFQFSVSKKHIIINKIIKN